MPNFQIWKYIYHSGVGLSSQKVDTSSSWTHDSPVAAIPLQRHQASLIEQSKYLINEHDSNFYDLIWYC